MVKFGLFVRLEAKPDKVGAVREFLNGGLGLVNEEPETRAWFALQFGPTSFGIFDVFQNARGREAHLEGPVAAALMAQAADLFARPPVIEKLDVLAAKLPA